MKAAIVYFSASGTGDLVARSLERALLDQGWQVQRLNMAKDPALFPIPDYPRFLEKIRPHDLLITGGPVYIDRMHYNLTGLLAALPAPDGNRWGENAFVFSAFGKVNPGVAAADAAEILEAGGRKVLGALEADCLHCISRHFEQPFSQGLPGEELEPLSRQAAASLTESVREGQKESITSQLAEEKAAHGTPPDEREVVARSYKPLTFDPTICNRCMRCVRHCPVNYLVIREGLPATSEPDRCIHCTNCVYVCPTGAMAMDLSGKEPFLLEKLAAQGLTPDGPSRSRLRLAGQAAEANRE